MSKGGSRSKVEGGFEAEAKIDTVLLIPNYRCSLLPLLSCCSVCKYAVYCNAGVPEKAAGSFSFQYLKIRKIEN